MKLLKKIIVASLVIWVAVVLNRWWAAPVLSYAGKAVSEVHAALVEAAASCPAPKEKQVIVYQYREVPVRARGHRGHRW